MPSTPLLFLALPASPAPADQRDDMLAAAGGLPVTGIVQPQCGSLFDGAAPATGRSGTAPPLWIEADLSLFPGDHPLVAEQPDAFAVRLRSGGDQPIDPRRPAPPPAEAVARLVSDRYWPALRETVTARLARLAEAGVAGLLLRRPDRLGAETLAEIVEVARARAGLGILLEARGLSEAQAAALRGAAINGFVSGVRRPERQTEASIEEYERLRLVAPVLHDGRADGPGDGLLTGAALAQGLILPVERLGTIGHSAEQAIDLLSDLADYSGAMRPLTGPGAPVEAVLRVEASDVRTANKGVVVLLNRSHEPQPLPSPERWLPAIGVGFDSFRPRDGEDSLPMLAPGEVQLLFAGRATPIRAERWREVSADVAAERPRLVVEAITPSVEGGAFAAKRVVGETVIVEAHVFGDGHEQLAAELQWRPVDAPDWQVARMEQLPNDLWRATLPLDRLGRYEFAVEGWLDRFGGFRRDFAKKRDAGVAQPVDHAEGRVLVEAALARAPEAVARGIRDWLARLDAVEDEDGSAGLLLNDDIAALMQAADDRPHSVRSAPGLIDAERLEARYSSWYELFPRSMSGDPHRHGTFLDVIERLPAIRAMGFDTLYFPPIHPIGRANRKGRNNSLDPGPDDPGSPYAIGSEAGGHDALHPELGSFDDFARLIAAAREQGLEIALDFAIQCSPDHPWLKEHPGWFDWRPDGTIKYAENPPKKYQDIVNVDFYAEDAVPGLWRALRDIVLFWVGHGVKVFRVDNPHTKPLPFWEWMIGQVRAEHPEVIFLAEAFTRPTMMYRLAKIGFSQSYTYFTWRNTKQELTDYFVELTSTAPKDFYRPHLFVNTPDINPPYLQTSGRPGFRIRAVLAATLSGLFGVYSGFELCEAAPLPGREEYLDSEKYELRPRDWNAPGNIIADIALLNRLRRRHPALQTHLNTRFYVAHNEAILYYGKPSPDGRDIILVMVNLDPHNAQEAQFEVPLWELGIPDHGSVAVEDLAGGHRFAWRGKYQQIRLAPEEPYRIWRIGAEA